ncbi:hypothetical protein PLESTB_000969000 [Pleodorina starrii]|uniref:Bidirectional sugar transporter SWEET n=1 Tax=Pleodorina starrii TaxID=330485 RepID=A0A9W6BNJ2_9CHLO|nr:hypothetical protein PLESTM_001638500 [Pleodorina starrii]GLC55293.1 hypothetical protein PLESTB_000969000 [Pleodorina starrii]GLC70952.1 hypothetical protein PLESTF_001054300 [Pleodorina starrii]
MASNVLLKTVVPALGAVVSTAMYLAPLKAVLRASRDKNLGELNPLPLSVTIANCIAWCCFGLLKHDPFVTAPNTAGVLIAVFMTLTAYGLADEAGRHNMRFVCCLTACVMPLLGVFTAFGATDAAMQAGVWGLAGNVISLIYYAAPLSTMWEVIRTRNSASILVPLTMMNTLNAALWTTYGIAVLEPLIWLPNAIGLGLSVLQVALRLVFPARSGTMLPSHQHHASISGGSGGGKYSRLDETVGLGAVGPR